MGESQTLIATTFLEVIGERRKMFEVLLQKHLREMDGQKKKKKKRRHQSMQLALALKLILAGTIPGAVLIQYVRRWLCQKTQMFNPE